MQRQLTRPAANLLLWGTVLGLAGLPAHAQQNPPTPPRVVQFSPGGGSYLGIGVQDVDASRAKELKLKEERGVEITAVEDDSPASRAGLRKSDVVLEMNGQPLPMLNGFPMRLVVPGWYATYWVKSLHKIEVLPSKFDGFWMEKAYRIPKNANASETPENLAKDTVPINRMNVRSIVVRPDATDVVRAGKACEIEGIAFDGGSGIKSVDVSVDGGNTWTAAKLDSTDYGKFSFVRWKYPWTPASAGIHKILTRATNTDGQVQGAQYWNKSGYMRNGVEQTEVPVV